MPLQGFTRFRRFQLGKQSAYGTAVTATRAFPYRGVPDINLNWTRPDVDTGTIDPAIAPYRAGQDITFPVNGPLTYNDAPYLLSAALYGGVSPTGATAFTWTFTPSSTTNEDFEYFTAEFGDDTSASDGLQLVDGIIENLTLTLPTDMSPWTVDANWRFGKVGTYPTDRASLAVDTNPTFVFGADTQVFINDSSGAIGTTMLTNVLHSATVTIENTVDLKYFANGSNTRFAVAGMGRAGRRIAVELLFAKSSNVFSEVAYWLGTNATNRYIELKVASPTVITGPTPYSMSLRFPLNWFTRADETVNTGNAAIRLSGEAFYDASGTTYPMRAVVVNTLASL